MASRVLSAANLLEQVKAEFSGTRRRKFAAGLMVALIDLMRHLDTPSLNLRGGSDFYRRFPRRTTTAAGKGANTLIVEAGGKTESIRPFYNRIEDYFRSEMKRFDYPSAAPHATQAWGDYQHWIDALVTFDAATLMSLRQQVVDFVLATLPSQEVDFSTIKKEPPSFRIFLEEFDFTAKSGEPTGSAFQGAVFAFIRADSPHLQVEVDKTRTGSKRLSRVGDVDAWDGGTLVKTCEVKHYCISASDVQGFQAFASEAARRKADAYVIADDFEDGVREQIEAIGIDAMSRAEMREHASVWDPLKQTNAMKAFEYFVSHKELSSSLTERFKSFCRERGFTNLTRAWPEPTATVTVESAATAVGVEQGGAQRPTTRRRRGT